jgi:hypothetical protein
MRNIWTVLALTVVVGCGGGDGKDGADGRDGAQGSAGPAGVNGKDGADGVDGKDGATGATGADGQDGADGADGSAILKGTGAPADGVGADGDVYIDTVSRDVYQKSGGTWSVITNLSGGPPGPKGDPGAAGDPGANGTNGTNGTSVRTGTGAPAAGLGAVGDVYIDSATGDLYAKAAGGWTKTGNLMGPAGSDGMDGATAGDTVGGVRWFAFALTAAFVDAPQLITDETYTGASSVASFAFTGANQHGRLAFDTGGSFVPGGVNLSSYEALDVSATITGGAASKLVVVLADGTKKGCQWDLAVAGPAYSVNLATPTSCYNDSVADPDFDLSSVTQIQVGLVSSGAGARTLTITDIGLVDSK